MLPLVMNPFSIQISGPRGALRQCSPTRMPTSATAGMPAGSQADLYTRLRLPGLRAACLRRTSLKESLLKPNLFITIYKTQKSFRK